MEACEYFEVCKALWEKGVVNYSYKLGRPFVKTAAHNWRKFNNCFTVNGTFSKDQVAGISISLWLQMRTCHLIPALCLWKHCLHTSRWKIKLLQGPSCQLLSLMQTYGTKINVHGWGWCLNYSIMVFVCQISTVERLQQGTASLSEILPCWNVKSRKIYFKNSENLALLKLKCNPVSH